MTSTVQLQCPHCCCVFDGDATLAFEEHKATHKNNKNPKGYVAILGLLHEAAKTCGYSLGIHGTLGRDLDLIAMPWVEEAKSSAELLEALAQVCGGRVYSMVDLGGGKIVDNPILKPHGRESWVVVLGGGTYLDVSVMPLKHDENMSNGCAEFLRWLKEQEHLAAKSEKEWREGNGPCDQATYRNGMWYAFHEAVQHFQALVPVATDAST